MTLKDVLSACYRPTLLPGSEGRGCSHKFLHVLFPTPPPLSLFLSLHPTLFFPTYPSSPLPSSFSLSWVKVPVPKPKPSFSHTSSPGLPAHSLVCMQEILPMWHRHSRDTTRTMITHLVNVILTWECWLVLFFLRFFCLYLYLMCFIWIYLHPGVFVKRWPGDLVLLVSFSSKHGS